MNNLKHGGVTSSATDSKSSPSQKPGISNAPRMLTPSEIESLRLHKAQITNLIRKQEVKSIGPVM